jgi:hypothetical protein
VSVKLIPGISINNASSNSKWTAVGRWATASDGHSQNCLQTLFFLSSFDETTTELHLQAEKLTETVLHLNWDTLWVFFCFVLFCFVLFFPLWWENGRTTSDTPSPGLEAEGRTPKLLRLKLYCIWTWRFFSFIYLFIYLFNPLSVSLMPVQLLISTPSTCLYLWNIFCFFVLFFLLVYLFFSFSLTSLLSIPLTLPF